MDSNHRTHERTDLQSVVVATWLFVRNKIWLVRFDENLEQPFSKTILQFASTFVIVNNYVMCVAIATII